MQEAHPTHSPTELSTWLACRRASALEDARRARLHPAPTGIDPTRDLLRERGQRHEAAYLEQLARDGIEVVSLRGSDLEATMVEMQRGAAAIAQASTAAAGWAGVADVLVRVETPSELGAWSYEVHDTKLAREMKVGAIVQLAVYSEIVGALQGAVPATFWVVPPGVPIVAQPFRMKDCGAYVRAARRRFEADAARAIEERLVRVCFSVDVSETITQERKVLT